jgi:hypothetical protein
MTKNQSTSKQPTHRVYAVTKAEGADKGFWTAIGAVWAHQDGKGFNVKLDFLPLNGAEIVIREPRVEQPSPDNE